LHAPYVPMQPRAGDGARAGFLPPPSMWSLAKDRPSG